MKNSLLCLALLGVTGLAPLAQAGLLLSLDPSDGNLFVDQLGQTVGWGFYLSWDGRDANVGAPCAGANPTCWIVVSAAEFTAADAFNPFTDFIGQFNFVALGPNQHMVQQFHRVAHTGIGSFTFNALSPTGKYQGDIVVFYDVFDGDPSNGATQVGFSESIAAAASVSIPEPSSWLLALAPLALIGTVGRHRAFLAS